MGRVKKLAGIKLACACAVMGIASAVASVADAATLRITVTNNSQVNGLTLTPLYVAFHNATFDAWSLGQQASAGIEELAELGSAATLRDERLAADPNSVGGVLTAPGGFAGAPLIEPGETATAEFEVDGASAQFFTFLSMILPSNDTFIGTDNAIQLFDANGNFLGPQIINVTGLNIFDAGTELTDPNAAPFIPGGVGTDGAEENGVITVGQTLSAFAGLTLPNGQVLDAALIDFLTNPGLFNLATISIEEVSEVPLPAAFIPMMMGLAGLGATARRKKKSAA